MRHPEVGLGPSDAMQGAKSPPVQSPSAETPLGGTSILQGSHFAHSRGDSVSSSYSVGARNLAMRHPEMPPSQDCSVSLSDAVGASNLPMRHPVVPPGRWGDNGHNQMSALHVGSGDELSGVEKYNFLLFACGDEKARLSKTFSKMNAEGITPNASTYTILAMPYAKTGDVSRVVSFMAESQERGHPRTEPEYICLLTA